MKFATKAIHAGQKPDSGTGAVMTPIFQTSTYAQEQPGKHQGYAYSRTKNPTRSALESCLASLENGKFATCFASGMAATDAVFRLLKPGDVVLTSTDIYGGSYRLFEQFFVPLGIRFKYVDLEQVESLDEYMEEGVKMVWAESPSNPMLNLLDLKAIGKWCKKNQVLLAVDNTFASPFLQNPLDLEADIVMHSVTKYLAGHSDVVMGALVVNDASLDEKIRFVQAACGAIPGPQDCYLTLRGIKTLHLRMERHCENAMKVAKFLASHPKVNEVNYPGLESHPHHALAKQQMRGFGGMLSFNLIGDQWDEANKLVSSTQVFTLAESLGGVESLIGHPASMTHAAVPKDVREALGVTDSLIRLSVGVEDSDDLLNDLKKALDQLK